MRVDLLDLLTRVDECLDRYVDVDDGDDGRPVANAAMSLQRDVRDAITEIERRLGPLAAIGLAPAVQP